MLVLVSGLAAAPGVEMTGAGLSRVGLRLHWQDRPVQLVGYSYYGLVADRGFDADSFLEMLAAHNINFTRFFLILPWPVEPGPNRLPFLRTDDGYDLRAFDEDYFSHLRRVVTRAERLGIICQVCLFDRCGLSIDDRPAWANNPYNAACNVNGLLVDSPGGYPAFCRTTGPIADINAALIRRVISAIGDRSNVIYEIMNEPYPQLGPLREWHAWAASTLAENLADRPGSKVISSTGIFDVPRIDVFSMHMAGDEARVESFVRQGKALGKPVILSDDGDFRCMYRPAVTLASARRALALGQHFEHLEFTLTLQREKEKRSANRLDAIPGHCQLNLRNLSELVPPLWHRPFVRRGGLIQANQGFSLDARVAGLAGDGRVRGERSVDGGRAWLPLPVQLANQRVTSGLLPVQPGARNLVRVIMQDRAGVTWPGPAYPYGPADEWSIHLGDRIIEAGLYRVRPNVSDGQIRPAVRGGESCYEIDVAGRGKYAYFALDEFFPRGDSPRAATVKVRFFDAGPGAEIILEYDAASGPYTPAPVSTMRGTGLWRETVFPLRDARFRGSQNDGADFRLSVGNTVRPLAISAVSLHLN